MKSSAVLIFNSIVWSSLMRCGPMAPNAPAKLDNLVLKTCRRPTTAICKSDWSMSDNLHCLKNLAPVKTALENGAKSIRLLRRLSV
ncbi:hypothetical protein PF005_g3582 [Phytophthora fragariae]|uniref:Secreted protein n=1 Tax=Phytophthora fragariae TaxID=53985 RepID=A0A6A4E0E4_9STRA|nr:hypothetical protein PF003_g23948 [Phytophthora fragariae]KAE8949166.1 hypothetical protein PF009_g1279 [Phytophthora fragariae]KAE9014355.1 hypothetical protein PF011_g8095 [Phytophthora fragariae]KAE9130442.1 hypothetical protein PF007_g4512 [Phytophthora fragariae]KAE9132562.1 hypothetical protein PF010_g3123 [Phytophthora fragariae]